MGSHRSVLTRIVFFLLNPGKQSGGAARLRRLTGGVSLRLGRGRGMEERLEEEVVQLVCALAGHGDLGRHQGFFLGGGGLGSATDTAIPATSYPGELGIGTVVARGGSGWRESIRGRLGCVNWSEVRAVRVDAIPARCGSSGLEAGAGGARGSGRGGAARKWCWGGRFIGCSRGGRG